MTTTIERWAIFELVLKGPAQGNPFVDVQLEAVFWLHNRQVNVEGFYDGDGMYRVRFMPDTIGRWRYEMISSAAELNGKSGEFECGPASNSNHGPVSVRNRYHFGYADGSPYLPIGTTCYAWAHQGEEMEAQTLATLRSAPFNKMRMCVFPKDYSYNKNEPVYYPYEKNPTGGWDYTRFNPEFFRHFEQRVDDLRQLGIEADIILFHPYDRWGFADMGNTADDRYLRYIVARLSAYRNVWWSLANEYDLMNNKSMADWDRFFKIIQEYDHAQHLRSVHNCVEFYDHSKPWVTHCSVQHHELGQMNEWREKYRKPVIVDECGYEGNIEFNWGNLTPQELVHRFWLGTVGGGYVGHGETYLHPEDVLWWSKGGVLHGKSVDRIGFLRSVLQDAPPEGLEPIFNNWRFKAAGKAGQYYLYYTGLNQPAEYTLELPYEVNFQIDLLDTWEMTITPLDGVFHGTSVVKLPGKPGMAIRARKVN